jgi:hypothetical protein
MLFLEKISVLESRLPIVFGLFLHAQCHVDLFRSWKWRTVIIHGDPSSFLLANLSFPFTALLICEDLFPASMDPIGYHSFPFSFLSTRRLQNRALFDNSESNPRSHFFQLCRMIQYLQKTVSTTTSWQLDRSLVYQDCDSTSSSWMF